MVDRYRESNMCVCVYIYTYILLHIYMYILLYILLYIYVCSCILICYMHTYILYVYTHTASLQEYMTRRPPVKHLYDGALELFQPFRPLRRSDPIDEVQEAWSMVQVLLESRCIRGLVGCIEI